MRVIALANRLVRDLSDKSFADITADTRLAMLDAINGGLQKLHAIAQPYSKETVGGFMLAAPVTISIGVTEDSAFVTGADFTADQLYCTIRIDGDDIDNQIVAENELLHPYTGATGTVSAVVYSDAVVMPEQYSELLTDPHCMDTGRTLVQLAVDRSPWWTNLSKAVGEPSFYRVEPNAVNQAPPAPAVIRVDSLPSEKLRYQARFTLAPPRLKFSDMLATDVEVPAREEHCEAYLLPIARGLLADSELWRNKDTRTSAKNAADSAESAFSRYAQATIVTPNNRVGTRIGY